MLRLVGSRDGREGSVTIHQDVDLYATVLQPGARVTHTLRPGRHAWVHVARGGVRLGDLGMGAGDGAAVSGESTLSLEGTSPAEVLVFDLA